MGARIERGREFNEFDLPSTAPVVIINDAMARRFWPGQDPVGKSLQIDKKGYQIVGVVEAEGTSAFMKRFSLTCSFLSPRYPPSSAGCLWKLPATLAPKSL